MDDFLKGKIALVTGSTSGIGVEIANKLLESGCTVILNYANDEKRAKQVLKKFSKYESQVKIIRANITNEEEVSRMFKKIRKEFNYLDFLINNAGISSDSPIEFFSTEEFKRIVNVNLIGKFLCTKHAIPLLKLSKNPSIINISSRLGTRPNANTCAYSSSQAAIINFTKCCAIELAKYNIRVNSISPSLTLTPLSLKTWSKKRIQEQKNKIPLRRLGKPEYIADAVIFLLSEKASYIHVENLGVNGGALL